MTGRLPETFSTDDLAAIVRWMQRRHDDGETGPCSVMIAEHIAAELDARQASPSLRADAWMLVSDLYDTHQDDGPR